MKFTNAAGTQEFYNSLERTKSRGIPQGSEGASLNEAKLWLPQPVWVLKGRRFKQPWKWWALGARYQNVPDILSIEGYWEAQLQHRHANENSALWLPDFY